MPLTPKAAAVRQKFVSTFGDSGRLVAVVRSPGRINLIGEHTDYNEGYVFPAAVNLSTYVAAQRRNDTQVHVFSSLFEERVDFDLKSLRVERDHGWANYTKGVLNVLTNRGWKMEGLNIYIDSDIPPGGGMSSSAALECAFAFACLALFPYQLPRLDLVKACQKAEHFVGVQCGIMDQFASVFGKKGHAIFLDCRSLKFEQVPLPLEGHSIIVINSRVKRTLATAEYNKRRKECEDVLKLLKTRFPGIKALRDLENEDMTKALAGTPEPHKSRAWHVAMECRRTRKAVEVLRQGDLPAFGKLMNESHASLRDLYQVSCPELDALAETAQGVSGVIGARMMGGGFGGCLIAIASNSAVEPLKHELSRMYLRRFAATPEFHEVTTEDGTEEYKQ